MFIWQIKEIKKGVCPLLKLRMRKKKKKADQPNLVDTLWFYKFDDKDWVKVNLDFENSFAFKGVV